MFRKTYQLLRSVPAVLHSALHTPTARDIWFKTMTAQSMIHPTIECLGKAPGVERAVIGKGCFIERDVSLWLSEDAGADPRISLGNAVYVGRNTYLGSYLPISIGDNCLIGAYSYVISGNHRFERRDIPICRQGMSGAAIEIADDVWLGTYVVVLPGVTIGRGAIVGAGSVVTKSIPAYEIWAGSPAKFHQRAAGMKSRRVLFIGNDASRSGAPMVLLHLIGWLKQNTNWTMGLLLPADGPLREEYASLVPVAFLKGPAPSKAIVNRVARRIGKKFGLEKRAQQQRNRQAMELVGQAPDLIYCNSVAAAGLLDELAPFSCPVVMHVHELNYVLNHLWWVPDAVGKMKRNATHYIACANIVRQNLIHHHGILPERISIVHEFIPTARTVDRQATLDSVLKRENIPMGSVIVGTIGSVEWRKGAEWFVPIARQLIDRHADLPLYFVWIGGGVSEDREKLAFDIATSGLADRVRLVGPTDRVVDWYAQFSVFMLLSREDPYPLVCLEAAAAGVPIVCFTGGGGMSEFVERDCGAAVPFADLWAFADGVSALLADTASRERMGAAAARKVRARHDVAVASPQILALLNTLMSTRE